MSNIQQLQSGESARSIIEKEVAYYQTLRAHAVYEIIQQLLSDTDQIGNDIIFCNYYI